MAAGFSTSATAVRSRPGRRCPSPVSESISPAHFAIWLAIWRSDNSGTLCGVVGQRLCGVGQSAAQAREVFLGLDQVRGDGRARREVLPGPLAELLDESGRRDQVGELGQGDGVTTGARARRRAAQRLDDLSQCRPVHRRSHPSPVDWRKREASQLSSRRSRKARESRPTTGADGPSGPSVARSRQPLMWSGAEAVGPLPAHSARRRIRPGTKDPGGRRRHGGRLAPPDEGGTVHAMTRDQIIVESAVLDSPRRRGEVLEVIEAGVRHYRVRWDDGHESIYFPGPDARVAERP